MGGQGALASAIRSPRSSLDLKGLRLGGGTGRINGLLALLLLVILVSCLASNCKAETSRVAMVATAGGFVTPHAQRSIDILQVLAMEQQPQAVAIGTRRLLKTKRSSKAPIPSPVTPPGGSSANGKFPPTFPPQPPPVPVPPQTPIA